MSHNLTPTKAVRLAKQAARHSTMRYYLGAILYDRTKYCTGWNQAFGVEVSSREKCWSIHAEEMAIVKGMRVGIDFPSSTLVVVRVNHSGCLRKSKPCDNCARLIEKIGIRTVFYIDD